MKAEQLRLVLDSLNLVQPLADGIAKSFYQQLFERLPQARKLFTGDMDRQGMMVMTTLSLAINQLSETENIIPAIQGLGERHYSYGVRAEYYEVAIESFLWAFEQHLGEHFTPAHREAWEAALRAITDVMLTVYEA